MCDWAAEFADRSIAGAETNVLGMLAVTQAVVPSMIRRRSGRIININSVVGVITLPFAGAYAASKAAASALTGTVVVVIVEGANC